MPPAPALDVARLGFDAYNRRDWDSFFELVGEDVVAVVPPGIPNEGVYHGLDGYRKMLEGWEEAWESFHVEPLEYIDHGHGYVTVPVRQRARGRGSGIEVAGDYAYVLRITDGKLRLWRLCEDPQEAFELARSAG